MQDSLRQDGEQSASAPLISIMPAQTAPSKSRWNCRPCPLDHVSRVGSLPEAVCSLVYCLQVAEAPSEAIQRRHGGGCSIQLTAVALVAPGALAQLVRRTVAALHRGRKSGQIYPATVSDPLSMDGHLPEGSSLVQRWGPTSKHCERYDT